MAGKLDAELLSRLVTATELAEIVGCRPATVRKAAKRGEIPGTFVVVRKTLFDREVAGKWTPPEGGRRVSQREDGRRRYQIYLTDEEAATLMKGGYEVIDPRVAAKARREKRKAEKAKGKERTAKGSIAPEGSEEDPFDSFGLNQA